MLIVENLSKCFAKNIAVDDVSFSVKKGEIVGLMGPNGAGKSTAIRMITGYLEPTYGTVTIGGHNLIENPLAAKKMIGYLPETTPLYPEMQVGEFLDFMGGIRGLDSIQRRRKVEQVMEVVSLTEMRYRMIDALSKGYRQRVCLAQALLDDPPILIMDEPTDGLDPNQKHEMRQIIRQMQGEKTIIISTHILEEVEAVCTRALILSSSKLIFDGSLEELRGKATYGNVVEIALTEDTNTDSLIDAISNISGIQSVVPVESNQPVLVVSLNPDTSLPKALHSILSKHKGSIENIYIRGNKVEEVFRAMTAQPLAL